MKIRLKIFRLLADSTKHCRQSTPDFSKQTQAVRPKIHVICSIFCKAIAFQLTLLGFASFCSATSVFVRTKIVRFPA